VPDGTVTGVLEVRAGPATRSLRTFRLEGERADRTLTHLGEQIDRTFGPTGLAQIRAYRREIQGLNRDLRETVALLRGTNQRVGGGVGGAVGGAVSGGRSDRRVGGGGGGGGGGRAAVRTINAGPFTFDARAVRGATLLALPAVNQLGGALVALGANAASAAGGLTAVGAAAGGAALGAIGAMAAATAGLGDQLDNVRKAQEEVNRAVREHGRASKEAAVARREFNRQLGLAPTGTRSLLREQTQLRQTFGLAGTRRADPRINSARAGAVRTARLATRTATRLAPTIGRAATRGFRATNREGRRASAFVTGSTGQRFFGQSAGIYDENLRSIRLAAQYAAEGFVNVQQAARPFIREGTAFIAEWTRGWATNTRDIGRTRSVIGAMVDDLRTWGRLGGAATDFVLAVGMAGRQPGGGLLESATRFLDRQTALIRSNPQQVRDFFDRAVNSTRDIAAGMFQIGRALARIGNQLVPLLDKASQFVTLLGNAGLLTPGVGALALGAFRGARGGAGGGGGGVGTLAAGAAGVAAGRFSRRGGATPTLSEERARRLQAVSIGGAVVGTGGAGAVSQLGRRGRGLGRLGGIAGNAARGAGRAFWPVALGMGALDFVGTQGPLDQKLQAVLSGLTLGAVPRPSSREQIGDRVSNRARDIAGQGPNAAAQHVARLTRELNARTPTRRVENAAGAYTTGGDRVASGARQREIQALLRELRPLAARQREAAGGGRAADLIEAFGIRQNAGTKRGGGMRQARSNLITDFRSTFRDATREGQRGLAAGVAQWTATMDDGNAKMRRTARETRSAIVAEYRRMGKSVAIVNGQILTGSREEWGQIREAMSSRAEKARQEVTRAFTAIQREAVGSLIAMGFTRREAGRIVRQKEAGGRSNEAANMRVAAGPTSNLNRGPGRSDIAQRRGRGGDGIGRTRAPRTGDGPGSPGLMGANANLGPYAAIAAEMGLHVVSGLRPGAVTSSGNTSHHASGHALDIAGPPASMMRFAQYMASHYGPGLEELIYSPFGARQIHNGQPHVYTGQVVADHYDHVHVADVNPAGGSVGGARAAGLAGAAAGGISLRQRSSQIPGAPGALSTRAQRAYARGLQMKVNAATGGLGVAGPMDALSGFTGGGGDNRALGRRMMIAAGWGMDQWSALNALWTGESGWNEKALNPSSGATGIPQSLPGSKMASAGPDWRTNPATQIKWGLGYIRERYGSPSAAYAAWQARSPHWYGKGGRGTYGSPQLIGVGDNQPSGGVEDVNVTRRRRTSKIKRGGHHVQVAVNIGTMSVGKGQDFEAMAQRLGDHVAKRMLAAIERAEA